MLKRVALPAILAAAIVVSSFAVVQAASRKTFKFTKAKVALGVTSTTDTTIDVTIGKNFSGWLGSKYKNKTVSVYVKNGSYTVYKRMSKYKYRSNGTKYLVYWWKRVPRTTIRQIGTGSVISMQGIADRSKTNRKFYARKIWIYSSTTNSGYGY